MQTTPKDIELTIVKPADKKQNVDVEITFSSHVGWDGASVLFFSLGIAGLFVYITFIYTKRFQAWHRQWVWLFLVLAVLYVLLVLKFLFTWKKLATESTLRQQTMEKNRNNRLQRSKSAVQRAQRATQEAKGIFEKFQMDGPWFLWKLYLSEVFESAQQCINLVSVYLCSLPVAWTSFICFGLSLDCFHTVYTLTHKNTPARRDRQVKIDAAMDFLCVAIPLSVTWFVYEVPISISEMLSITLAPICWMLCLLDDILEEGVRHRSAQQVLKEQTRRSLSMKRRRESVFGRVSSVEMAKTQEDRVPWQVRATVASFKGLFGLFFLVLAVVHLILKPTACDKTTWEKGCAIKIPFCKSLFTPTCNCASLRIENDFTLTALPNSLVDKMQGLRKVFIRNCNLTALPPNMEQLTEMVDFEVTFNQLQSFDVDVLKWEKLIKLHLSRNNITRYNEKAVWTHLNVQGIDLFGNALREIPIAASYLPYLYYLHIGENGITVNVPFGAESFPRLLFLYLNGNDLKAFPSANLNGGLLELGVARCNLKSLPLYLSNFRALKYLDVRDNNITFVDKKLKSLIENSNVEAYFSGNSVLCKIDKSVDCVPLCSNYCYRRNTINNGKCDNTCDTKSCQFDGGDCK